MIDTEYPSTARITSLGARAFLSKIPGISDAENTSPGLLLAIYQVEEKRFLYFSRTLRQKLGNKAKKILLEGWNLWFTNVAYHESPGIRNRIRNFLSVATERKPISLKYHINDADESSILVRHEIVLYRLRDCTLAINYLFDISERERIERLLSRDKHYQNNYGKRFDRISPREKEVLELIADGYSSKQIAGMLCISNHTAITHRKNLIAKFGVRNTAQLIKNASLVMEW
ncbi:helix-turn-helix transcriptional regulator [Pricia sp. S334]|uniref:Helix-turn-helix transcriptional regulator n=1 Tax=Pricia mediterranea TaxID=3076079 RepID=A0ABU3L4Q1_9FLAO|nr:helix-turn-helix transcriptional regulator [Pricia sp. S334]MDT7828233.1 helix-turn-helix transcriptional regulator [Pricia sp. S334]